MLLINRPSYQRCCYDSLMRCLSVLSSLQENYS